MSQNSTPRHERGLILTSLILATTFFMATVFAADNEIVGVWSTEDGTGQISISVDSDGSLIGLGHGPDRDRKDSHNPDVNLRERSLYGAKILWGFKNKKDDKNTWVDGQIYDPNNGKTYSSQLRLEGHKLNIRGYVGIPLFGRTTTWTRKGQ